MQYTMTTPCAECPFLIGSGFTYRRLTEFASGEFPCHKACDVSEETGDFVERNDKTPHCAGALIFLEKQNTSHQMMRICERLGLYDWRALDMNAPIGSKAKDYPKSKVGPQSQRLAGAMAAILPR